jgi:hypothetical protein
MRFLEVFFFCIDEIDSPADLLILLRELLVEPGTIHLKIVAYALATKPNFVSAEARQRLAEAQLQAAIEDTPATVAIS